MTTTTAPVGIDIDASRLAGLRRWNIGLAVLHAVQAVVVLVLATDFTITITSTFPTGPPGTDAPAPAPLADVRIGAAIALFLALAAVDHLLTGTVMRDRYERGLREGINRFRWVEYSLSATVMVLLVGSYAGLTDITTIIAIAGANVGMILFGWLQEAMNPPGGPARTVLPFWFGTLVGLTPWIAITVNIAGSETVPGFVYGIFISLALFFGSFGVNQWLQYRRVGPWAEYAFGEKVYLVLSLAAKSALAWQIFAGSLAG
jgi:hypothetical protein